MKTRSFRLVVTALAGGLVLAACEPPPVVTVQRGFRGTGMQQVYHPANLRAEVDKNAPPPVTPSASPDGPKAGQIYQNVKVLGDLSVGQFAGLMVDITSWVAPAQGCSYCHVATNFADDSLYTKQVARRMIQMTQRVNSGWKVHVQNNGVTCYTCHRGNNVPTNIWYSVSPDAGAKGSLGNHGDKIAPSTKVGMSSLTNDPFTPYLQRSEEIRVIGNSPLPVAGGTSIKHTELTYGLMMHMATSLGVNCTYCHNSRAFAEWPQSSPQRSSAWYGIRMVRELNNDYLISLNGVFPDRRLGPTGDVPKLNCATCHQGAYKPLYGADILHGYPGLTGKPTPVQSAEAPVPVAAPVPGTGTTPVGGPSVGTTVSMATPTGTSASVTTR